MERMFEMYLQLAQGVKRSSFEIVVRSLNVKARVVRCFFELKDALMIYQNQGFALFICKYEKVNLG